MAERVVDTGADIVWEPNIEHAVLSATEDGDTTLELLARIDDPDQRAVVLVWSNAHAARIEGPNDEARSGHPLFAVGLRDVRWIGEVLDSSLVAELERRNSVHPGHNPSRFADLRHWVVPLKGAVVEVVSRTLEVRRRPRATS